MTTKPKSEIGPAASTISFGGTLIIADEGGLWMLDGDTLVSIDPIREQWETALLVYGGEPRLIRVTDE